MAVPALLERRRDAELVEYAPDDVIDDVVDRLRMIVEGRHRRQHGDTHARELEHVLEMDLGEWRLAHDQHQLAALLEDHIGGAMYQMVAHALGNAAERT